MKLIGNNAFLLLIACLAFLPDFTFACGWPYYELDKRILPYYVLIGISCAAFLVVIFYQILINKDHSKSRVKKIFQVALLFVLLMGLAASTLETTREAVGPNYLPIDAEPLVHFAVLYSLILVFRLIGWLDLSRIKITLVGALLAPVFYYVLVFLTSGMFWTPVEYHDPYSFLRKAVDARNESVARDVK